MNSIKREENTSFSAAEGEQNTRADVSEDTVVTRTWPGTPAAPSLSDTGERSGTSTRQSEAREQEAALKIPKPGPSNSEKRSFTFNFHKSSKQSDWSELIAYGELHENIRSALRANADFSTRMKDCFNKNIIVYEDKEIKGYVNLGMPLKCLPPGSHCTITVEKKGGQEEADQILRRCENPDIDCIHFHVAAVGKTTKKITKLLELHKHGRTLYICALKGETIQEALRKDGRFRSDLDELPWKLWEGHNKVYGKDSPVEVVAGKILVLDIPPNRTVSKGTQKKTKQENENTADDTRPRARVRSEGEAHEPEKDGGTEDAEHDRGEGLPPQSPGHDIKGKRRRTMARIRKYYDDRCRIKNKYIELTSRPRQRPHQSMSYLTDSNLGTETADLWLK
ncbi:protein FAM111B-like, partial [Rousettus aegyptiacus]|uniref:protein FAM111B-like n=1 Tax=Rousettus aegyptiacus TaxID=9407 RepID=UPI00168CC0C6